MCAGPAAAAELVFHGGEQRLEAEVAEASAVFVHGAPSVSIQLREGSAAAFADLTEAMVGEVLAVSLCGHELVRAVVRERISGQAIINMPEIGHAVAVTEVLLGEADCDQLEELFVE